MWAKPSNTELKVSLEHLGGPDGAIRRFVMRIELEYWEAQSDECRLARQIGTIMLDVSVSNNCMNISINFSSI